MDDERQQRIEQGADTVRRLRVAGLHDTADDLERDVEALRQDGFIGLWRHYVTGRSGG